jgi:hypothetical protein
MLAHGGAGGAVAEAFFILVPIGLFALLARKARRQREHEESTAAEGEAEAEVEGADPETTAP